MSSYLYHHNVLPPRMLIPLYYTTASKNAHHFISMLAGGRRERSCMIRIVFGYKQKDPSTPPANNLGKLLARCPVLAKTYRPNNTATFLDSHHVPKRNESLILIFPLHSVHASLPLPSSRCTPILLQTFVMAFLWFCALVVWLPNNTTPASSSFNNPCRLSCLLF